MRFFRRAHTAQIIVIKNSRINRSDVVGVVTAHVSLSGGQPHPIRCRAKGQALIARSSAGNWGAPQRRAPQQYIHTHIGVPFVRVATFKRRCYMRTKVLTLMATAMAVVGIGVLPSLASAAAPEAAPPKAEAGFQSLPSAVQARVIGECPASYICFWSGKTFGQAECQAGLNCFSAFHGYEVGWHNLESINPQSMYNHTGEHIAAWPFGCCSQTLRGPGETYQWGYRYEGGFEIA
jgi:hypothetical protein